MVAVVGTGLCGCYGGDNRYDIAVTFVYSTTESEARTLVEGHGLVLTSFDPGNGVDVPPTARARVPDGAGDPYALATALESDAIVVSASVSVTFGD